MHDSRRVRLDTEGESGLEAVALIVAGLFQIFVIVPIQLIAALVRYLARPKGRGRRSA